MPKKILLIILLFLASGFFVKSVIAAEGHSITGLSLTISPKLPRVNQAVKSFSAVFKLKSKSGLDTNRIKVFVNKTQIQTKSEDFTILDTIDDETIRVEFKPSVDLAFTKTENTFKLEYWLTRVNSKNPLATKETTIYCRENTSSGGDSGSGSGTGGGTDNGSTSNGDVVQINKILYLNIEDTSTQDIAQVSKTPKQLRLIVEHDENYVSFVDKKFFNPSKDVVLKYLTISAERDGEKVDITDELEFDLENGSTTSSERTGYLITKYISDPKIIEDKMTLRFKVDLTNYLDKYDVSIPETTIPKASTKIDIQPIQIELEDIDLEQNLLSFSKTASTRNNFIYKTQDLNLKAKFTSANHTVSSTTEVGFETLNSQGKTIKPKIKYKKQISLPIDPSGLDEPVITVFNGSTYNLDLPFNIILNANKANFRGTNNALTNPLKPKTLFLPILINSKSSQNLEMEIKGTLTDDYSMEFEI